MNREILDEATVTVLSLGPIIGSMDSEQIIKMINEFSLIESASVVFDAMQLQGSPNIYDGTTREKFWNEVSFRKEFLEKLLPLVQFVEKTKKEIVA